MLSFRNALLKIGRPTLKPVYNILDPNGLKLLTRLKLGLSHLNEHKSNHNFKECVNIHYAPVVCKLSLFPTFFCTVITSLLLTLFQKPIIYTILACQKMLQHFTAELMFSSTPFSHLQYHNGTNLMGEYDNLQLCYL